MTLWRHKKKGLVYEVIDDSASMQCSAAREFERMFEDDSWTIYRSTRTGAVYVRPTPEFLDGRFEKVADDFEEASDRRTLSAANRTEPA